MDETSGSIRLTMNIPITHVWFICVNGPYTVEHRNIDSAWTDEDSAKKRSDILAKKSFDIKPRIYQLPLNNVMLLME